MLEVKADEPRAWPVEEQTSGSYFGTLTDDLGAMIPGSVLTALQLTLWVVRSDGSVAYINNRNHQDVLNANNVTVFDALQSTADGKTYNLRWNYQIPDTTLVETLPFERHLFLFEFRWTQGNGKRQGALVVRNIAVVT